MVDLAFTAAAERLSWEQILALRVGRVNEVARLASVLGPGSSNVYLWGDRGIGKTFLTRLLDHSLKEDHRVLGVRVSAAGHLFGADSLTSVASGTMLAFLETVWTKVLGKKYSELRATLTEAPQGDLNLLGPLRSDLERTTVRLYQDVMSGVMSMTHLTQQSIGVSLFAKGDIGRSREIQNSTPALLPFEFAEYAHELREALLREGLHGVTITLDEANTLSPSSQGDLLSSFIDLFGENGISFLFIGGYTDSAMPDIRVSNVFGETEHLRGLDHGSGVALITKVASACEVTVTDSAAGFMVHQVGGNPRLLIDLVRRAAEATRSPVDDRYASELLQGHQDRMDAERELLQHPSTQPNH